MSEPVLQLRTDETRSDLNRPLTQEEREKFAEALAPMHRMVERQMASITKSVSSIAAAHQLSRVVAPQIPNIGAAISRSMSTSAAASIAAVARRQNEAVARAISPAITSQLAAAGSIDLGRSLHQTAMELSASMSRVADVSSIAKAHVAVNAISAAQAAQIAESVSTVARLHDIGADLARAVRTPLVSADVVAMGRSLQTAAAISASPRTIANAVRASRAVYPVRPVRDEVAVRPEITVEQAADVLGIELRLVERALIDRDEEAIGRITQPLMARLAHWLQLHRLPADRIVLAVMMLNTVWAPLLAPVGAAIIVDRLTGSDPVEHRIDARGAASPTVQASVGDGDCHMNIGPRARTGPITCERDLAQVVDDLHDLYADGGLTKQQYERASNTAIAQAGAEALSTRACDAHPR